MYKFFLILNLLFIFNLSLYGDIITLKNGKKLEGKIINQTRERVQIQLENGNTIILDKSEIQKIQFGPTDKEIEKKRQEELRKLEEEKRRQEEIRQLEEEKKRKEELKKLEEKKRKEIEKQKIKEPLLKRKELIINYGIGLSNTHLPLEKIESNFSQGIYWGSLFLGSTYTLKYVSGIKKNTANSHLEFIYNVNDWSFGFSTTFFNLNPLVKNLSYYEFRTGTDFQKVPPQPFSEFEFSIKNEIKNEYYGINNLWGKYTFLKFNFLSNLFFLSIPFGFYDHSFNFENRYLSYVINEKSLLKEISNTSKINSNNKDTYAIFTGIIIESQFQNNSKIRASIYLLGGSFSFIKDYLVINFSSDYNNIITNFSGQQKGVDASIQYEKEIYEQISFFAQWNFNEFHSNIKKTKISAFFTSNAQFNFYDDLGFLFDGFAEKKDKKIIEKNHFFTLGINYKFNL